MLSKNLTDSGLWVCITPTTSTFKELLLSPQPETALCLIMLIWAWSQDFSISSRFASPNSFKLFQSFTWTLSFTILLNGCLIQRLGSPGGLVVKNPPANAGNVSSVLGSGRSSVEGNGNPLQYSCLGNSMDRGAWQATVHGVPENRSQRCN